MREQGATQAELDNVIQRARHFYQTRRNQSAPSSSVAEDGGHRLPEGHSAGSESRQEPPPPPSLLASDTSRVVPGTPAGQEEPPYPVSFDEIAELVASGKPIPGIREIPDKINEQAPSEPTIAKMAGAGRKPWER